MAGERLDRCLITKEGLEGDRQWALIDGTEPRVGKFYNIKQNAALMTYAARLADGELHVTAPDGAEVGLDDALHQVLSDPSRIVDVRRLPGGNFDDAQVHIVNLASIDALELEAGMPLDRRRFRANLYVEGLHPEEELLWLGKRIRAGDAELEVVERCVRCAVITRDPDSTVTTPELLELLVQRHDKSFGLYCRVVRPGSVALGDSVGPV